MDEENSVSLDVERLSSGRTLPTWVVSPNPGRIFYEPYMENPLTINYAPAAITVSEQPKEETKEDKMKKKFDDRARTDFEVGDLVKIRSIESMKNQFSFCSDGTIECEASFTSEMYPLAGAKAIIQRIYSDCISLRFLTTKRCSTNFTFTKDMIEIVEKNYVKNHKKERKEMPKYSLEDEIVQEMIGKVDVKKVKRILSSSFQISATKLVGVQKMLEDWATSKRDLYLILGKNLRIEKEIKFEAGQTEWQEKINNLAMKFPGTACLLIDSLSWRNFKDNRYTTFSSSFERRFMPDAKEGMKLTTFLSHAFKNPDFDTEVSKIMDETTVKGIITISIDPIDYLLMSLNKSGWESCHSIHEGRGRSFGCYVGRNIQLYV